MSDVSESPTIHKIKLGDLYIPQWRNARREVYYITSIKYGTSLSTKGGITVMSFGVGNNASLSEFMHLDEMWKPKINAYAYVNGNDQVFNTPFVQLGINAVYIKASHDEIAKIKNNLQKVLPYQLDLSKIYFRVLRIDQRRDNRIQILSTQQILHQEIELFKDMEGFSEKDKQTRLDIFREHNPVYGPISVDFYQGNEFIQRI